MHLINRFKTIFWDNRLIITFCCFIGPAIGVSIDVFENKKAEYRAEIVFDITGGMKNSPQTRLSDTFGAGMAINDNLLAGENFFYFVKSRPVLERNLMKFVKIKGHNVLMANLFIDSSGIEDEEWKKGSTLHNFRFRATGIDSLDFKSRIALNELVLKAFKSTKVTSLERKSSFKKLSATMNSPLLATLWVSSLLKTVEEVYSEKQSEKAAKALLLFKNRQDSLDRLIAIKDIILAMETDKSSFLTTQKAKITVKNLQRESNYLQDLSYETISDTEQMQMQLVGKEPLFVIIEGVSSPLSVTPAPKKGTVLGCLAGIIAAFFLVGLKFWGYQQAA